MKPTPELIAEAARRGIVEGAIVHNQWQRTWTVGPSSDWVLYSGSDEEFYDLAPHGGAWIFHANQWATVITPAPSKEEEGLKEGDACECGPAMRAAIIGLAKELGLWDNDCRSLSMAVGIWLPTKECFGKGLLYSISRMDSEVTAHTPEAFIAKMRVTALPPKPIKIDGHTVEFFVNGDIKVGCTFVGFAALEAVYNKAKATKSKDAKP